MEQIDNNIKDSIIKGLKIFAEGVHEHEKDPRFSIVTPDVDNDYIVEVTMPLYLKGDTLSIDNAMVKIIFSYADRKFETYTIIPKSIPVKISNMIPEIYKQPYFWIGLGYMFPGFK